MLFVSWRSYCFSNHTNAESEKKTCRGILPEEYEGQFGGKLKSWLQLLHHYGGLSLSYNTLSLELLNQSKLPKKDQKLLGTVS